MTFQPKTETNTIITTHFNWKLKHFPTFDRQERIWEGNAAAVTPCRCITPSTRKISIHETVSHFFTAVETLNQPNCLNN
jgi:hypothetical protein